MLSKAAFQDNLVLCWEFCISLLLIKSIYLIKFNPTLENLDHIQNSFLKMSLFYRLSATYFGPYSFHIQKYPPLGQNLEKAMAPHSSTLAWKIPWTEEPGRLQSMGLLRVGHNWVTSLWLFTFMHWRRKWQPTPVFLPRESQGWGSLVSCHLWGCTESDTTEVT